MKLAQKVVCTLIIIMLSGGALYAVWTREMNMLKINAQSILAILGILAVVFSVMKVLSPSIKLKIVSCYYTLDQEKRGLCILKLQTISNVDLTLEDVVTNVMFENGNSLRMIPSSVRWKGVVFKMPDRKDQERDYKLLKPLNPDLRICGIKRGRNECYIFLKSEKAFEDKPIKSWSFELKYQHHLLPVPNLPWFNRKVITVVQPQAEDLYFDDSLFQKISAEERQKLIDEL